MPSSNVATSKSSISQHSTAFVCLIVQTCTRLTTQAHLPSPHFLNIHGLTATGKSSILRSYFHFSRIQHTIINVRECITTRHLLERIVAASLDALDEFNDESIDRRPYVRTENLSVLCVNMGKMLAGRGKFVLMLDAVDKLREGGGTLIAALGRLGEMVHSPHNLIQNIQLTMSLDTRPLHHPHDNPPIDTLGPPLLILILPALPLLHPRRAPHNPRRQSTQDLLHAPVSRTISRLHARPRRRRRRLALGPLPPSRLRLPLKTHRPRPPQLQKHRNAPLVSIHRTRRLRPIRHTRFLAPDGKQTAPLPARGLGLRPHHWSRNLRRHEHHIRNTSEKEDWNDEHDRTHITVLYNTHPPRRLPRLVQPLPHRCNILHEAHRQAQKQASRPLCCFLLRYVKENRLQAPQDIETPTHTQPLYLR
jgi:hypothetical protein